MEVKRDEIAEARKQEKERIVTWLREHWIGYDTTKAPGHVRLTFGGTQQEWESFIGKP